MSTLSASEIHEEATAAAQKAAADFRAKHGEPMYCGFAWVVIKPATTRFARDLKKLRVASPAYRGGIQVYNPSKDHTQSMSIKEAGAEAYAEVLRKHGINAYADSRAD